MLCHLQSHKLQQRLCSWHMRMVALDLTLVTLPKLRHTWLLVSSSQSLPDAFLSGVPKLHAGTRYNSVPRWLPCRSTCSNPRLN